MGVVNGLDDMGRVAAVEVLDRQVRVFQGEIERHALCQQLLTVALKRGTGFLVDVGHAALGVIVNHVDHRGREDTLIAQHIILRLATLLLTLRDIVDHTDNHLRRALPVTTEDGEPDHHIAIIIIAARDEFDDTVFQTPLGDGGQVLFKIGKRLWHIEVAIG